MKLIILALIIATVVLAGCLGSDLMTGASTYDVESQENSETTNKVVVADNEYVDEEEVKS